MTDSEEFGELEKALVPFMMQNQSRLQNRNKGKARLIFAGKVI